MIKLPKESLTLSTAISEYLLYYRAKGVTEKSYFSKDRELNKLLAFLGDQDLNELDIRPYYISVLENDDLAINSKGTYLRSIRAFVRWCNREYELSLPEPTILKEDTIKETYSNEELQKLLVKPKKWKNFPEYRTWVIIQLLIDTGIRSATLRDIRKEDVNYTECYIITRHSKTRKQQIIPISTTLSKELYKLSQICTNTEWLFPDQFGNQLSETALKLSVKRYNLDRGVNKTSVHLFRHTFAKRYLLEMNGDAFRLQKLLGHSSMAMTRHYANIYDKDILNQYKDTSPLELLKKNKIKL